MKKKISTVCFIFLSIFILSSCAGNKKIVKSKNNEKPKEKYNLDISDFPKQELILEDTNFLGYLNIDELTKVLPLKNAIDTLKKKYFLNDINYFYFTVSDIYKSQEFLIFLKNYQFDVKDNEVVGEVVANREIVKTIKTDNQEFGYINFEKDAVYGDISFIKELYSINKKKLSPISDERYELVKDSEFLSSISIFKLLFMPNADYSEMLLEFVKKQTLLKPLVDGLKYLFIEGDILDNGDIKLKIVINSSSESINLIYNFINTQKKLLMTLNGNPFSRLSSKDLLKNVALFKNLEIKKLNENKLVINLKILKKDSNKYLELLKNIFYGKLK